MTTLEALQQHRALSEELHQLALEENRHLRLNQTAPGAELLDRKRTLLERLDSVLSALREVPQGSANGTACREAIEQTKSRILQILQLDRENEQLLLRHSLGQGRTAPTAAPAPAPTVLQKIYQRHS
jgi:hypothetical protein